MSYEFYRPKAGDQTSPFVLLKRVQLDIKRKGIDVDRLHNLLSDGYTQVECAAIFGVSRETIRRRLGLEKPRIRDNTGSKFCTPIATKQQSDRTNSIAGRV